MRLALLLSIVMAGCVGEPTIEDGDPIRPLHDAEPEQRDDEGPDCSELPYPEVWHAHLDRSLSCVPDQTTTLAAGWFFPSMTPYDRSFEASNGTAGHGAGTALEVHVYYDCAAACIAEIDVEVRADGKEVARLTMEETLTGPPSYNSWIVGTGTLSSDVAPGARLALRLQVDGVAALVFIGQGGDWAPWLQLGSKASG